MLERTRFAVFEVINEKRREIYVGATNQPIFQTLEILRRARPKSLKDWNLDDIRDFRSIEFDLLEDQARVFIARHITTGLPPGWRFLV